MAIGREAGTEKAAVVRWGHMVCPVFYPLGDEESWKCFMYGCDDFKSSPVQQDKAIVKPHIQILPPNRNVNWCSHCQKQYGIFSKN